MSVLIVTSVGDLVVDLHTDLCPRTTYNFLKLCKMKYYNECLFHNVQKDFIAQTGDPTGTGEGGDSVYKFLHGDDNARFFDDEICPELTHSKFGTVAMASAGENRNASQFYITLRDDVGYLDGTRTVFGTVALTEPESLATLRKINEAYVDDHGRPFKDIRIKHTYVLDDPHKDPPQLAQLVPENSPRGKPKDEIADVRLEDTWAPLDERLDPVQLKEMIRSKEAHTNAVILQCIGDIPVAEVKPPDNVLFVCDLNPVTQDEDLYTIFSRFGTVTSAEIIRDYKTGDSLCYAFVEFEATKVCERAYKEMNNCLIDDRRICVDFSQSVSKMWGPFRQGMQNAKKDGRFKCDAPDYRARNYDQGAQKENKDQGYVLKNKNTQRGGNNRQTCNLVFVENGTTADKHDCRDTGRRKIQKLDDWRSEPPHKGDRDRKCRHDDHTSYDRSGNRSYNRHNNRDYSKHQSRSRDQELISITGIREDDDCRKGDRCKGDESCHRRSNR